MPSTEHGLIDETLVCDVKSNEGFLKLDVDEKPLSTPCPSMLLPRPGAQPLRARRWTLLRNRRTAKRSVTSPHFNFKVGCHVNQNLSGVDVIDVTHQ